LEGEREVREVLEPDFEACFGRGFAFFFYQEMGFLQAALLKPAAGRKLERLLKIALEGGPAAAREVGRALCMMSFSIIIPPRARFLFSCRASCPFRC
jgi:hypothetical protein